jgi:2-dehydropantoate 2-reductase
MRYTIYGAGGVGATIGGRLVHKGYDVVFVCRGEHLTAIQQRGLTLKTPTETLQLSVPAVGHPREIRFTEEDVVFLAMKSQDTEAALRDLEEAGGSDGAAYRLPVVCCQNGVDNERMALRRFARVYGMVVWLPATYLEPGVVFNEAVPVGGVLDLGRYPEGVDDLATQIAADLSRSGFSSRPDPHIMRWKYTKLLSNIRNALQAVCGYEAQAPDLVRALREEALACYRAAGIDFVPEEELRQRVSSAIRVTDVEGHSRQGGSSWQSLARGLRSIEADFLNGEIVLLGALHGVPTPYNRLLQRLANQLAREGKPPGSVKIAELRQMLSAKEKLSVGIKP